MISRVPHKEAKALPAESPVVPFPRSERASIRLDAESLVSLPNNVVHLPPKEGWFTRIFSPKTWEEKPAVLRVPASLFFKVFKQERAAWVVASGASFSARIGVSGAVPYITDSRTALLMASYLTAVSVSWPLMYKLLRAQDRRECINPDGSFDQERYDSKAKQRLYFLPKQEIGALCCFTVCGTAVMGLSYMYPTLFGAKGAVLIAVASAGLQYFSVLYYDKIFRTLRKASRL